MFCCRIPAVVLLGLLLSASLRAEEPAPEKPPAKLATPQLIAQWVNELDDNEFDTRERAQFSLEAAGAPALDSVAKAAESGSLEASTRALNILLAWVESDDTGLRIGSLERIATLPQRPTEAHLAGEILADAREEAALAKIVELGGTHTADPGYMGGAIVIGPNGRQANVQVIIGAHWKGGVEGLKHLKKVRRATTLSLHSAPLGDEVIPVLLDLPHIKRFELYGKMLSSDGIAKLREKLSPEMLAVRSAAQLGIQGSQLSAVAQVERVVLGSAAEKAGLRRFDVITQLDGQEVKDFKSLTDRIATYEPGDTVTLKVTRPNPNGGESAQLDIQVTFDKWGESNTPPTFSEGPEQQFQGQIIPPGNIRIERR